MIILKIMVNPYFVSTGFQILSLFEVVFQHECH